MKDKYEIAHCEVAKSLTSVKLIKKLFEVPTLEGSLWDFNMYTFKTWAFWGYFQSSIQKGK